MFRTARVAVAVVQGSTATTATVTSTGRRRCCVVGGRRTAFGSGGSGSSSISSSSTGSIPSAAAATQNRTRKMRNHHTHLYLVSSLSTRSRTESMPAGSAATPKATAAVAVTSQWKSAVAAAATNSVTNAAATPAGTAAPLSTKAGGGEADESKSVWNAPASLGRQDEGLSRYPHLRTPGGVLRGLDYAGTMTFAASGCVTAAQSGLDVFGCCMVGMITGVGGGTVRDAIFLAKRPFWTMETEYIWMTIFTAFVTFYAWPYVLQYQRDNRNTYNRRIMASSERHQQAGQQSDDPLNEKDAVHAVATNHKDSAKSQDADACICDRNEHSNRSVGNSDEVTCYDGIDRALDVLDSIGLAAFAIIGAQNGIRAGVSAVVCAVCGMTTSTFGGLMRDVLCGRPVRIVHSNAEIYAEPALIGAAVYLFARRLFQTKTTPAVWICASMTACMGTRYVAIRHNIKLHTWDTRNDGLGVTVRK